MTRIDPPIDFLNIVRCNGDADINEIEALRHDDHRIALYMGAQIGPKDITQRGGNFVSHKGTVARLGFSS